MSRSNRYRAGDGAFGAGLHGKRLADGAANPLGGEAGRRLPCGGVMRAVREGFPG